MGNILLALLLTIVIIFACISGYNSFRLFLTLKTVNNNPFKYEFIWNIFCGIVAILIFTVALFIFSYKSIETRDKYREEIQKNRELKREVKKLSDELINYKNIK